MECSRCSCKFCWMCLEILPERDPYSHFTIKSNCWDISAAHVPDEMYRSAQEEKEERKYIEENTNKVLSNCTKCPCCGQLIDKGLSKVNLMKCQECKC